MKGLCKHYKYEQSPIGLIGGCSLGYLGGLHAVTCYGKGDCQSYEAQEKVSPNLQNRKSLLTTRE